MTGPSTQSATEGSSQTFTLGSATDSIEPNLAVDVNWEDGTTPDTTFAATSGTLASQSHTYAEAQSSPYVPQITVVDQAGNRSSTTFNVNVADAPLVSPVLTPPVAATLNYQGNYEETAGVPFSPITVFQFTDDAGADSNILDYTAIVTLGDGNTVTLNSAGLVTGPGITNAPGRTGQIVATATPGVFDVQLSYTFTEQLVNQTFGVTVTDVHGSTVSASTSTFNVSDQALVATAVPFSAVTGQPFTNVAVATFTDPGGAQAVGNYSATIDWGDPGSTTTTGLITYSGGVFTVSGGFTYASPGTYSPTVTITHTGYSAVIATDTATVTSVVWVDSNWQGTLTSGLPVTALSAEGAPSGIVFTYDVNAFSSIGAGIAGLGSTAGTVNVLGGTYTETDTISTAGVTLEGYGFLAATVTAPSSVSGAAVISVSAANATVGGLDIVVDQPYAGAGIAAVDPSGATSSTFNGLQVLNNVITSTTTGTAGYLASAKTQGYTTSNYSVGIAVLASPADNVAPTVIIQGNQVLNTGGYWVKRRALGVRGPRHDRRG